MKPTRYEVLRQAVDETFDVSQAQWERVVVIDNMYPKW